MSDVKWIKITTDIFDDEKVLIIESMPDSYAIITVWFKLLCLAGKSNNSGVFIMSNKIPYTDKMLSAVFRMKESTVQLALSTFQELGMIEIVDGVITIPNWSKHQSLDSYEKKKERDRLYQAQRRASQVALIGQSSDNRPTEDDGTTTESSDVAVSDKEEELDIEIDKRINYQRIADMYNSICISFPKVKTLSENRKKAIRARLKTYSEDEFRQVFEKAEASNFLKGKNANNWSADFDWLITDRNMARTLEGKYDNNGSNRNSGKQEHGTYL